MRDYPVYNWLQPTSSFTHDCSIEVASGCWSKSDRLNSLQTQKSCNFDWGHEKGAFRDIGIYNFYSSSASSSQVLDQLEEEGKMKKGSWSAPQKDINPERATQCWRFQQTVISYQSRINLILKFWRPCNFGTGGSTSCMNAQACMIVVSTKLQCLIAKKHLY